MKKDPNIPHRKMPPTEVRNATPLMCVYCFMENKETRAHFTLHDQRGCLHVCFEHCRWRMTTSWAFGHSEDCAFWKPNQVTRP